MAKRPLEEFEQACKWINLCYEGQGQDERLSQILACLSSEREKIFHVEDTIKKHPLRVSALIGGFLLAVVGVALAATGILAPLGAALGWAGLSLAAPSAVAAVGAMCFAMPAIIGGLVVGCIKGIKALVGKCFPGPGEKQSRSVQPLMNFQDGFGEDDNRPVDPEVKLKVAEFKAVMPEGQSCQPSAKTKEICNKSAEAVKAGEAAIRNNSGLLEEKGVENNPRNKPF